MTDFAYICREPECGCATIALVDSERAKKENAREMASAVRRGMSVERLPMEEARAQIKQCPHWKIGSRGQYLGRTGVPIEVAP